MSSYVKELFSSFVSIGVLGGAMIGFTIYLLSLGISFAYKSITSATNVEEVEQ